MLPGLTAPAEPLAFLANAGAMLIASADYDSTIALLPDLTVPGMADWCVVDLAGRDGALACVAIAHADPAAVAVARAFRAPDVVMSVASIPPAPLLVPELLDASLEEAVVDPEQARLMRRTGARSLIRIPLRARGRALGVMTLLRAAARARFAAADLALAEDLAWRAALAIDKAALHREAEEAVRIRDRMLSIVSHDLANPLHVIELNARLLAEDVPDDERRRSLDRIARAGLRMKALLRELVDVAHLRDGHPLELDRTPTDLVALARQLVEELRQEWPQRTVELETACPELRGMVDRHRIERVIANLLSNAAKYSAPGGRIRVEISRAARRGHGAWAVIAVVDTGAGIPAAELPFVFDLFRRGQNVRQRVEGSGIGLASAQQAVTGHGGTLTVRSVEGRGSTFTVKLPLSE